jgi:hypothetical protein
VIVFLKPVFSHLLLPASSAPLPLPPLLLGVVMEKTPPLPL